MLHKVLCLIFLSFVFLQLTIAQVYEGRYIGVQAGMGVSLINSPDIIDYINVQSLPSAKLDDFGVAAEFFGAVSMRVTELWDAKLEYAYLVKSYNVPKPPFPDYKYSYEIHMPTAIIHYLYFGQGYFFKLGGGIGYHLARFTEDLPFSSNKYKSNGLGIKLEIEGDTEFDEHLFGCIGLDLRDDFMGEFKDSSGKKLLILSNGKNAKMSFFGLGVKFGLVYYF